MTPPAPTPEEMMQDSRAAERLLIAYRAGTLPEGDVKTLLDQIASTAHARGRADREHEIRQALVDALHGSPALATALAAIRALGGGGGLGPESGH